MKPRKCQGVTVILLVQPFLVRLPVVSFVVSRSPTRAITAPPGTLSPELSSKLDSLIETPMKPRFEMRFESAVNETRGQIFGTARPASTMVVVSELARPELKIEVNATALLGG